MMGPDELLNNIDLAGDGSVERPLGLYVHIPFCSTKCHFCDWVVNIPVQQLRSGPEQRSEYVNALCKQIEYYGPRLQGQRYVPKVMYWGGGTPTRLDSQEIVKIKSALDNSFDMSHLQQWTVETTPNDLTAEKLDTMLAIGVNRISVGVQSFNQKQLLTSGRGHSVEQAEAAGSLLQASGIENFNMDLITGFPGEDLRSLETSMLKAISFGPTHISIYPYRATPETVMAMQIRLGIKEALSFERMMEAYELAMKMLEDAGYYEYCYGYYVRERRHEDEEANYSYSLEGDKIGFGSGADSVIGHLFLRNEKTKYRGFLENPLHFTVAEKFSVHNPKLFIMFIGGALMTDVGIHFERFEALTGTSFHELRSTPYIRDWLNFMENCGAVFRETDQNFYLAPEVRHKVYISHLSYTVG